MEQIPISFNLNILYMYQFKILLIIFLIDAHWSNSPLLISSRGVHHENFSSEVWELFWVYIAPSWATFIFFITPKFCTVEKQLPNIGMWMHIYVHCACMHAHFTPEVQKLLWVYIGPSWATFIFFITPKFCTVEKQLPNIETCMQGFVHCACMHANITPEMKKSLGVYIWPSWGTLIFFITPKFCTVEMQLPNIETCMHVYVHCTCMHAHITPNWGASFIPPW